MMKKKIIVGSRDSKLAVAQTRLVMDLIQNANPNLELELVTMKTTGDKILDKTLDKIGGKGLFVKELDQALIEKRVDITVHSLKDLPMEVSEDLPLLAFVERGNPFDCLVMANEKPLNQMDKNLPVGSSSGRRNTQLGELLENVKTAPVRGNVITRLEKLDRGDFSCLILARAGLERIQLDNRITKTFTVDEMIPAAGQGILVVQGRKYEDYSWLEPVDNKESRLAALCERAFVRQLDGGCTSPIGAYAKLEGDTLVLNGFYQNVETGNYGRMTSKGKAEQWESLAIDTAVKLKEKIDNE